MVIIFTRKKIKKMLPATLKKNDKKARVFIYVVSLVVFAAVALLSKFKLDINPGFDVHVFAMANAIINSLVMILLGAGLVTVKLKRYAVHKKIMLTAIILSVLFLVSYIAHHLLAGETKFGDIDHDGILSDEEKITGRGIEVLLLFHFTYPYSTGSYHAPLHTIHSLPGPGR